MVSFDDEISGEFIMTKNLEIEYKTLITSQQYIKLMEQYLLLGEIEIQENFYFDTPSRELAEQNMGLRIRIFDTTAEQTSKISAGKAHSLVETTIPLNCEDAKRYVANESIKQDPLFTSQLEKIHVNENDLTVTGHIKTSRLDVSLPIGRLAIDKTYFEGHVDHELELEVTNAKQGKIDFEDFLARNQIALSGPIKNKVQRMAEYAQR